MHKPYFLAVVTALQSITIVLSWIQTLKSSRQYSVTAYSTSRQDGFSSLTNTKKENTQEKKKVVIIGGGWAGLSAAHALSKQKEKDIQVTVVEASPRVGGLVRDGFTTQSGDRPAEAGQHGFWNNYHNIYKLFDELQIRNTALTDYAEQGQYSPAGLEAIWPVYRNQQTKLPTGLAQAAYTRFLNLPLLDKLAAVPLVLAFSEFDESDDAWRRYDNISFRDLCVKLRVSERCYREAFEPMILTGLFAPGKECSAAAALGMAYFFVLQSQNAFDVQWCKGNIGDQIFTPWVSEMKSRGVQFQTGTKVTGFDISKDVITGIRCTQEGKSETTFSCDHVVIAVGASALNAFVRFCPELAGYEEFQGFANLRGTSVLATRIFLDKNVTVPYSANACWGFDKGVGMTMFDIRTLHGKEASTIEGAPGAVIEVDYYHASRLLVLSDDDVIAKVKSDLDSILNCHDSTVVDAAVVRLPNAVNWYFPGSYQDMPSLKSNDIRNLFYAGDIVKTDHGSWSQEKAYVTGVQAANLVAGLPKNRNVVPVADDETHVRFGRDIMASFRHVIGNRSFLVDFLW